MNSDIKSNLGPSEWWMLLGLSVIWGGSFFFIAVAVAELPPFTIVVSRVLLAALALWAVVAARGMAVPRSAKTWLALLVMGAINNAVPFTLITYGEKEIASGLAGILIATTPLFTVLTAGVFLADERITAKKIAGVVIGMAGVAVMIGPTALKGLGGAAMGQLAVVGGAASYALAGVYGRRFKALGISPIVVTAGQATTAALLLLPLCLAVDRPFSLPFPSPAAWGSVLALGFVCTAFAYVFYFRILAAAGATNIAQVTFLVPVSAVLLGWLFLGERLELIHLGGMALIALGLSAIDGRLWRRRLPIVRAS